MLAGAGLVAAATVAGAWLARRGPGQRQTWFAAAGALAVPAAAGPVLLAMAAGVLAQAARVSLRAAFRGLRPARVLLSRPAATTTMAAIITALAVHTVG